MLTEAPPLPLQERISLVRPPPPANLLRAKLHYGLKFKRLGIEMPEGVFHDTRRIYDLIEFDWLKAYPHEILHTRHELHVVSSDASRIVVRLVRRGQLRETKQFVDLADSYYAMPKEPCELYPIDGWGDPSPIPVDELGEAALEFFGRPMTARLLQQFATATKRIDVRIAGRELRLKGITNDSSTRSSSRSQSYQPRTNGNGRSNGSNGNGRFHHNGHHASGSSAHADENGSARGTSGAGARKLTQAQERAIGNMLRRLGEDGDAWVHEEFGIDHVTDLTVRQASQFIDVLKAAIEEQQPQTNSRG